jgi:hypothetical protein
MEKPKISYSNLKTLYVNVYDSLAEIDTIPLNPKSVFTEFFNDIDWIESYVSLLYEDIELMEDEEYPSMVKFRKEYERYAKEWEMWLEWLNNIK